ncbi:MAG: hypothetical protein K2J70_03980 [Muribaculaceae bacterium]|nr:hypothetical protein [Muribaculaceae bacterium]
MRKFEALYAHQEKPIKRSEAFPARSCALKSAASEAYRKAMLLCLRANAGGAIPELASLRRDAHEWIETFDSLLPDLILLTPGDALELLESRDFIHRIAFNAPPLADSGDQIILLAFQARIKGDPGVNIFTLHRALDGPILRRRKEFLGAPFRWHSDRLEDWYREAQEKLRGTVNPPPGSMSDIEAEKAAILLRADLYDFDPDQKSFKRRLVETLPLEAMSSGVNAKTLLRLLFAAYPYIPLTDYERLTRLAQTRLAKSFRHPYSI